MISVNIPTTDIETYIYIANIIGVIAFAASGAFKGIKYNLDILGVIILGIITASGGGIIRDSMLNRIPGVLKSPQDIFIAIITSIIIFLLLNSEESTYKFTRELMIMDSIGLAVFAIIGARIAMQADLSVIPVGIIAAITGVGGGVIRDLLSGEIPAILKEDIYAVLAFAGGLLYKYMIDNDYYDVFTTCIIVFCLLLGIRLIIIRYKWSLPKTER